MLVLKDGLVGAIAEIKVFLVSLAYMYHVKDPLSA
jgi:hypothetical protein